MFQVLVWPVNCFTTAARGSTAAGARFFLCHQKNAAGSMARLLKIQLERVPGLQSGTPGIPQGEMRIFLVDREEDNK